MNWRSFPLAVWLYSLGALALGTTALWGGGLMLLDPAGTTMGLEVDWLAGTPFQDYFVPGLILFTVLGIGSFVVLYGIARRKQWAWWAAVGLGVALVGWIVTQALLLRIYHVLQIIYGALGVVLILLAVLPSTRSHLRQ